MFNINNSNAYFRLFLLSLSFLLASSCTFFEKQTLKEPEDTHCSYHLNRYVPERIILNLTTTPSQSQAVTWRTRAKINEPKAQIASLEKSPAIKKNLITLNALTEKVRVEKEKFVYHYSAVFKNLKPNTLYAYRVGSNNNWSEWNQFKTAEKESRPFKFLYLGDPQEKIKSMCSRIFRFAYKKAPDADFWLFIGDLVDDGKKDDEWDELFYALGWIPKTTPIILLPGNHEYPDKRFVHGKDFKLTHLWRPHFTLPENGPDDLKETVYFIDYQGVRFVMLNGNEKIEQQAIWLDKILSENPQRWTIAAIHQPIYSTAKYRKNSNLQTFLVPIFDKYSVDLVLQGHDHTYCRSYKIKNGVKVGKDERGTVYIISVSGPKFYTVNDYYKDLMVKMETGKQLFQAIHIDNNKLIYESFDAKGDLFDSFILEKY